MSKETGKEVEKEGGKRENSALSFSKTCNRWAGLAKPEKKHTKRRAKILKHSRNENILERKMKRTI